MIRQYVLQPPGTDQPGGGLENQLTATILGKFSSSVHFPGPACNTSEGLSPQGHRHSPPRVLADKFRRSGYLRSSPSKKANFHFKRQTDQPASRSSLTLFFFFSLPALLVRPLTPRPGGRTITQICHPGNADTLFPLRQRAADG